MSDTTPIPEIPSAKIAGTYNQINHSGCTFLTARGLKELIEQNQHSGTIVHTLFINSTREDIVLTDRYGYKTLVPATHASQGGGGSLRIIRSYHVQHRLPEGAGCDGHQWIRKVYRNIETSNSDTSLNQLRFSYRDQYFQCTNNFVREPAEYIMIVQHIFHLSEFRKLENRQAIYHKDTDYLICMTSEPDMAGEHPYSSQFSANSPLAMTYLADDRLDRGMASLFEIVDSDNRYGYRYMWMAGQVVCIKPIVDRGRLDGVYFKYHANAMHDEDTRPQQRYCKLEDMGVEFGLYPTQEEAITGGNPELITRANKLAQDKELEELKAQHAREGVLHKRERDEAEERARIEKLEHDNKVRALELEHSKRITDIKEENERRAAERKDFYEQRSTVRKDTYEDLSYNRKDQLETANYSKDMIRVAFVIITSVLGLLVKAKLSA